MAKGWASESKERQLQGIRRWRPWEWSTGPTAAEGKSKSSRNAYSGAERQLLKVLGQLLEQNGRVQS